MRDSRLDNIRVLAILMVITVHTWSLAKVGDHALLDGFYHAFEDCGVPLFLMLSGALSLSASIGSVADFYRKRLWRILLPFLGYSLVVYVLNIVLGRYADIHSWQSALVQYVPYLLENRINYAYWYVPLIVVLSLLTPLLQPALERVGKRGMEWLLVAWFVLVVLQEVWPEIYFMRYTSSLLLYLGYYVAGHYFYRYHLHPSGRLLWLAAAAVLVGGAGIVLHCAVLPFWGMLERVAVFVLLLGLPGCDGKVMRFCSQGSYDVYLVHFLFITPLYGVLHFSGATASLWQCIAIPAATTVVVAGISYGVYGALCLAKKAFGHIASEKD